MQEVQIDGVDRLVRALNAAGLDLGDLKAALKQAAEIVEQTSAGKAPRGDTDRLVNSLRSSATKKAGVVRAGRKTVPYAGPIHWGWPKHNIKPQTFIADAARNTEPQWVQVFEREVDNIIEKATTS